MDEIKYKLNSNNVMVITEALSLLLKSIEKCRITNSSSDLEQYLQLLRDQCVASNHVISSTACFGFIKLIQDDVLDIDLCLSSVMSMILCVENYSGILAIISSILTESVVQDTEDNSTYTCRWDIINPIHPFIFILQLKKCAIDEIISRMETMCSPQSKIYTYGLELFKPTFIWILCNRENRYSISQKKSILNIILTYEKSHEQISLLLKCLTWQEISGDTAETLFYLYLIVEKWSHENNEKNLHSSLLPVFINIAYELILNGYDPTRAFKIIEKLFLISDDLEIIDCSLGLITEVILICPILYMEDLLLSCNVGCAKNASCLTDYMLLSALIQWDYNKNILTQHFCQLIKNILNTIMKKSYNTQDVVGKNEIFNFFKITVPKIFKMSQFCLNFNYLIKNENKKEWVDKWNALSNVPMQSDYLIFFQSLLLMPLEKSSEDIKITVVRTITDIISKSPEIAIRQLPISLYSLRISTSPLITIQLLKGIPILASLKENVSIVIGLLKNINNKVTFSKSLLIVLYLKLYIHQPRCFPYLQTVIAENLKTVHDDKDKWEILLAQADAMKYVCENDGVNHGLNLAPLICGVIDQSKSEENSIAFCTSLEAIIFLWKEEIIDPISTWNVLAPKLHGEKRETVLIKICELLKIIPSIDCKSTEYLDFIDRAVMRLWKYTEESYSSSVNLAALNALSQFKLEMLTLKQIPDKYKEGVTVPSKLLELKPDENQKPEDVLDYIPNIVWGNLFKYTRQDSLPGVVDLCSTLINCEISGYRSGVYEITVVEPDSVKYLPNASVVRGVLEFLRKEILKKDIGPIDPSIIQCIKCISTSFDKPLPPLNWNFLSNVIFNEDPIITTDDVILVMQLLSKLSGTSQSAMKLITTYLESLINIYEEKHIQILSSILPNISITVKSGSLMNLTDSCFQQYFTLLGISNIKIESDKFLNNSENTPDYKICLDLLKAMCTCIENENVHVNLRNSLFAHVKNMWTSIDCDSVILDEFSTICCQLPYEMIQKILQPHNEKNYRLRCKLATDNTLENPLDWLNDLIDFGIENHSEQKNILATLVQILKNTDANLKSTQQWVSQLKARILFYMGQEPNEESLNYLFDILILSVIIFSQHCTISFYKNEELLTPIRFHIFPQSLCCMIQISKEWENVGCQLLEWFQYCLTTGMICQKYHKVIYLSFLACQDIPHFREQNVWTKYACQKLDISFI